jgi:hypothetical protein
MALTILSTPVGGLPASICVSTLGGLSYFQTPSVSRKAGSSFPMGSMVSFLGEGALAVGGAEGVTNY